MQNGNVQNVTEPDFRKKFISGRICRKNLAFWHFLEVSSLVFSWFFCTKMRISNAQNMTESDFLEKFFSGRKCRKPPFFQIFDGLSPNISLFFQIKTLLITIPTIRHDSIVNNTDFWSRNCLKITGTADFRRKNGIS